MTQPTIDLSKDLELWFEPSTKTFDSQRNRVLDKSGYGRRIRAIGGPTISDDGYASFGKASFDGNDDYFTNIGIDVPNGESWSHFVVIRLVNGGFITVTQGNNMQFNVQTSDIRWYNADFNTAKASSNINEGEWYFLGVTSDGSDTYRFYKNGEFIGSGTASGSNRFNANDIGRREISGEYYEGDIAFHCVFSRVLSDAEIKYLNRLTGPRRAQL